ncbi:phospholipase [Sporosarcina pasteurii]|uniref:Parvovirus coat protein VP1 n=1 Tax=Sporosarcina pasteurii TaxID=1474 RepID=A0A380CJF1_SPOPA|nr:phospholipase [Sporosarcina pasteurii]MDS9471879.1 phospholipase [Sporosarcina pasteurii]QBQ06616.1 phospholipase [Sporosarcina pasteurii]SUJ21985.1 Parvovirus coat protein VP1 [Sporosarcina pasteurii]
MRHRARFCVLPGYNWCGPGCNGPGEPINEIDVACKAHDKCYALYGDKCQCDEDFLNRLYPYIHERSQRGRHARLLYHYMRMQSFFTCRY